MQDLEGQVGQIANLLSEKALGGMPSNIKANPQEHLKAITLRSGKQVAMRKKTSPVQEKDPQVEDHRDSVEERDQGASKEKAEPPLVKEYIPRLPYLSKLKKDQVDEQFKQFLHLLKQLHINVLFVEALAQMPK